MPQATGCLVVKSIDDESRWARFTVGRRSYSGVLPIDVYTGCTVEVVYEESKKVAKATSVRLKAPEGHYDKVAFLKSTLKGVGEKTAGAIVHAYANDDAAMYADLQGDARSLAKRAGLTQDKADTIVREWNEAKEARKGTRWLFSLGLTPALQARVAKHFRLPSADSDPAAYVEKLRSVIDRIKENPYILTHVNGIGFKTADEIALRSGVDPRCKERAQAAVVYVLEQAELSGSCYATRTAVLRMLADVLGHTPSWSLEELAEGQSVFGLVNELVFLVVTAGREKMFSDAVRKVSETRKVPFTAKWVDDTLSPTQRSVLDVLAKEGFVLLTGGPGTGKTHTVGALVRAVEAAGMSCLQCAPTGKAARRITERSGIPAYTIHALLKWRPGAAPLLSEPIDADVLIVDEASMLDIEQACALFSHIDYSRTYVVLVGDPQQLPSVGPGAVLRDLCALSWIPRVDLHEIFRQASGSGVAVAAREIQEGRLPASNQDFTFVEVDNDDEAISKLPVTLETLRRLGTLMNLDHVQILTPGNESSTGVKQLNEDLAHVFNPTRKQEGFSVRDRVMHTKNDAKLPNIRFISPKQRIPLQISGASNGETGVVVYTDAVHVVVDYGDRCVQYTHAQAKMFLVLAFALTIHKSQGSEFPHVVILLGGAHTHFVDRSLIYTGVTRAKKSVTVIARRNAVLRAIATQKQEDRITLLKQRLRR